LHDQLTLSDLTTEHTEHMENDLQKTLWTLCSLWWENSCRANISS
jgi:hypothetical protein